MIKGLNHVAIAVKNLEETAALFQRLLGLKAGKIEVLPDQGVRSVMLYMGNAHIELIQPVESDSGVAKFIEKRGEGIHHISLDVDDVDEALRSLELKGAELIDKKGRKGTSGRIGFIHPRTFKGVLMELTQEEE